MKTYVLIKLFHCFRVTKQRSQNRLDVEAEMQQSVEREKDKRKRENMDMALVMDMDMAKKLKTNMLVVLVRLVINSDKSHEQ
ncbi:hypothetical protein Q8A73_017314 [Channa argus]|nr:hypothetical protein Q8A73_017314 [Channa argus]